MEGATMPLRTGQLFAGDYRVVEPLSAGGMGAVYVVDQLSTGKRRALKLMHPALIVDPELRKRFEQEARIGARIESAHIVEVQAAGVDSSTGMPWLVMELLTGEDFASLIRRTGALPPTEVREIFEQICHALGAAHRASIVHRDLKPENVFIGRARHAGARIEVKVLDFGIAKLAEESGSRSTAAMGSPAWMAPEQTERTMIDVRADVWALGLVAYYALTGRMFWKKVGEKWIQLAREIIVEPLPSATQRAAEQGFAGRLPPDFDAWFGRCVARDPSSRFENADALWAALKPILGGASHETAKPIPVAHTAHANATAVTELAPPIAAGVGPTRVETVAAPTVRGPVRRVENAERPVSARKGTTAAVAITVIAGVLAGGAYLGRRYLTSKGPPSEPKRASKTFDGSLETDSGKVNYEIVLAEGFAPSKESDAKAAAFVLDARVPITVTMTGVSAREEPREPIRHTVSGDQVRVEVTNSAGRARVVCTATATGDKSDGLVAWLDAMCGSMKLEVEGEDARPPAPDPTPTSLSSATTTPSAKAPRRGRGGTVPRAPCVCPIGDPICGCL
jgi:tRNA A-37 threonylcarbamoyl transferase component Bud32